jgi:hypothetical protein
VLILTLAALFYKLEALKRSSPNRPLETTLVEGFDEIRMARPNMNASESQGGNSASEAIMGGRLRG